MTRAATQDQTKRFIFDHFAEDEDPLRFAAAFLAGGIPTAYLSPMGTTAAEIYENVEVLLAALPEKYHRPAKKLKKTRMEYEFIRMDIVQAVRDSEAAELLEFAEVPGTCCFVMKDAQNIALMAEPVNETITLQIMGLTSPEEIGGAAHLIHMLNQRVLWGNVEFGFSVIFDPEDLDYTVSLNLDTCPPHMPETIASFACFFGEHVRK